MTDRTILLQDLACELGCTVEELAEKMSEQELATWRVRAERQPFGITGQYVRLAASQHLLAAVHTPKKSARRPKFADFYLPPLE